MSNENVCQHCGVVKIEGHFYWSNRKPNGDRYTAEPNEVYSKVCSIAKYHGRDTSGCINNSGCFNKDCTWIELSKQTMQDLSAES